MSTSLPHFIPRPTASQASNFSQEGEKNPPLFLENPYQPEGNRFRQKEASPGNFNASLQSDRFSPNKTGGVGRALHAHGPQGVMHHHPYGPKEIGSKGLLPDHSYKPTWTFQKGLRSIGKELISPKAWLASVGWGTLFALGSAIIPPHVHGFFVWLPCVMIAGIWRLVNAFIHVKH